MSRFQHRAELAAIPRSLVDEVVRALIDALEGVPFTDGRLDLGSDLGTDFVGDVRLVEGEHLTAGARYRIVPPDMEDEDPDIQVSVVTWDRAGEYRVEVTSTVEGHVVNARVDLRMVGQRLHGLRAEGDYQGPGSFRFLQRARWEAEARFEDWWSVLGHRTPPISLRVRHPLASASLMIDRGEDKNLGKGKSGRWSCEGTLRLGGRTVLRPLTAAGLLVMRRRINRVLRKAIGRVEAAWNAVVPGVVENGLQERVTLRHQVEVETVSREWAEEYVGALHQAIEGLHFEKGRLTRAAVDIQLLAGEHIGAGSRYRIASVNDDTEPLDVTVVEWDFAGPSRIEVSDSEETQTGWAELNSAHKPTLIRGALAIAIEDLMLNCAGEGNLERWWAGVADSDRHVPAFTATVDHPLAGGTLSIAGSPATSDRWAVEVTMTVAGNAWARPLVAVAGLTGAAVLNDAFASVADETAEDWNRMIPAAIRKDPAQTAEATLRKLLDEPMTDRPMTDQPMTDEPMADTPQTSALQTEAPRDDARPD